MLIPDQQLIRKHSYLRNWYHAVLALTPLRLRTLWFMPLGGARVKIKDISDFFSFSFFMESFVFEQQVLFKVESLCNFLLSQVAARG